MNNTHRLVLKWLNDLLSQNLVTKLISLYPPFRDTIVVLAQKKNS